MVWMVGSGHISPWRRSFESVDGNRIVCGHCAFDFLFQMVFEEIKKRELFMNRLVFCLTLLLVVFGVFLQDTWACSVCFGDPNSPMTHGAKAGVVVLLGVVVAVLGGILGVAFYWIRRARLLQVQAAMRGESVNL
jgi:hypothetical protein